VKVAFLGESFGGEGAGDDQGREKIGICEGIFSDLGVG